MHTRDKKNLLFDKEPITRRKQKLEYLNCQILQCRKDKLEYERKIKLMENDFREHEVLFENKHVTDEHLLAREKSEALKINEYKEFYKMEMLKRNEEEAEK